MTEAARPYIWSAPRYALGLEYIVSDGSMIRKGQTFGDWTLERRLGSGGNGFVWLAVNSRSESAAIKILAKMYGKRKDKVYARFRDEVEVIRANGDIQGLLPIIDSYLPARGTPEVPWYCMPVAAPLERYLVGRSFEAAVKAVLEVGEVLVRLHARGIFHRDIKPANILVWNGRFILADFGLVDFPEKTDVTKKGERIGPIWTIAPEMRRGVPGANSGPADVYSLAKTLWILLTGRRQGFDGQYQPSSVNGLGSLELIEPGGVGPVVFHPRRQLYLKPLDQLLISATSDDPSERPTIGQFVRALRSWTRTYRDFRKRNPLQWDDVQTKLFPVLPPERAIWRGLDSIVRVLDHLGSVSDLNHMFLPGGGGLDLLGARVGSESGTVELRTDATVFITKPRRLLFENFGFDREWNYFRLEADRLQTITGSVVRNGAYESLVEVADLVYLSREEFDNRHQEEQGGDDQSMEDAPSNGAEEESNEKPTAPYPRFVERILRGDLVIFQKTSTYNRIRYTYDGRHSQMNTDEFRTYIQGKVDMVRQALEDPDVAELAAEKELERSDFIFLCLQEVFRKEYLERFSRKGL